MTLIVAMANDSVAAIVADRRTSKNGQLVSDDFNKVTVLFCDDARLSVAFTGLATYGDFNTSEWIAETLYDIGQNSQQITVMLQEFIVRAGLKFAELPPESDRRLTIVFCGFVYWGQGPEPRIYTVSNFQNGSINPTGFLLNTVGSPGQILVEFFGNIQPIKVVTRKSLRDLLTKLTPPSALIRFAVKKIQAASSHYQAQNRIGQNCNGVLIKADVDTAITNTYHTAQNASHAYGPNVVVTQNMIVLGSEVMSGSILSGPDIRKQDKCWCGSGDLFKHCHLQKYGQVYVQHHFWNQPLFSFDRVIRGAALPSGRVCLVTSGYE
jgi:SEC-C motif